MLNGLGRLWRIAATGFCFVVFGFLGLMVLCVFFPICSLFYRDTRKKQSVIRSIMHYSMAGFSRLMVLCGCFSLEVRNREKLNRNGLLIVANHPSLIDVVLLIGLVRRMNCVVKASLKTNLFTRGPVKAGGFIVNSDGPGLINDGIASVRAGDHLIIFPEGTRSLRHDGELSTMKRGAANIALRGGIDLTPVLITTTESMLGKGQSWYQVPRRRPHFVLTVMDDIPVSRYLGDAFSEREGDGASGTAGFFNLKARALTQDLGTFFVDGIRCAQASKI